MYAINRNQIQPNSTWVATTSNIPRTASCQSLAIHSLNVFSKLKLNFIAVYFHVIKHIYIVIS